LSDHCCRIFDSLKIDFLLSLLLLLLTITIDDIMYIHFTLLLSPSYLTPSFATLSRPSKTLGFYLKKVDEAVAVALAENPDAEIVLLAHSIGGTVRAALYLQIESHLDATIVD
jgi:hypothetical protein